MHTKQSHVNEEDLCQFWKVECSSIITLLNVHVKTIIYSNTISSRYFTKSASFLKRFAVTSACTPVHDRSWCTDVVRAEEAGTHNK